MVKGFKDFILRGNVVDLSVAFVIGAAFAALVNSFVENVLTPLIAIPGTADFSSIELTVSDSTFFIGEFLNDVIAFLLIAAAVYFFLVRPTAVLIARRKPDEKSPTKQCPECLSSIPEAAGRCAFCTSLQPSEQRL